MHIFKRKEKPEPKIIEVLPMDVETDANNEFNPLVVSVPEIKEYLVREFETTKRLQGVINELKEKLEDAEEFKIKYDAAMVTIDGYSKKLEDADDRIFKTQEKLKEEKEKHSKTRDALNSLKIRLHDTALTKTQIKHEIINEIKTEISMAIKAHKGTLSKATVVEIINNARLPKEPSPSKGVSKGVTVE